MALCAEGLIELAYRKVDPLSYTMDYHYHDGFEIFQVWSDGGYVLVEDKIYPMHKGYIYVVNSLDLHRTNPSPEVPYIRSKLTFTPLFIRSVLEQMDQLYLLEPFMNKNKRFSHNIVPDNDTMQAVDQLFAKMAEENKARDIGYPAMIRSYLIELLVWIYRWYCSHKNVFPPISSPGYTHVQKAISYITCNLQEDLTLERLCEVLHISKYYLCHSFKEITGLTIMEYITQKRIAEAKRLLLLSEKDISNISEETGFSDISIFSRTFKRFTGLSPTRYREMFSFDL